MKASDNPYPSILVNETTAPSAPAASKRRLYADANHILRWIDSSSLDSPLAALNKWNATVAPAVTDDSGDGYAIGSRWINTTGDTEHVCTDATVGAAVWVETTSGGGGGVATDPIWDAAGDLAVGTGADTASRLAVGAAGKAPISNGATLAYAFPYGHLFDYATTTSDLTVTATTNATAQAWITGNAVTYDGSTRVLIEGFAYFTNATGAAELVIELYDGSTDLGRIAITDSTGPLYMGAVLTPSNAAHTYSLRAWRTGTNRTITSASGSGSAFGSYLRILQS